MSGDANINRYLSRILQRNHISLDENILGVKKTSGFYSTESTKNMTLGGACEGVEVRYV
jgi:hypothetical protein